VKCEEVERKLGKEYCEHVRLLLKLVKDEEFRDKVMAALDLAVGDELTLEFIKVRKILNDLKLINAWEELSVCKGECEDCDYCVECGEEKVCVGKCAGDYKILALR